MLRLKWPRSRKGYEFLEIRRSALEPISNVKISTRREHGYRVTEIRTALEERKTEDTLRLPADATLSERRLAERWGRSLRDYDFFPLRKSDGEIIRVIHPRGEQMHVADVLATAPDCFIEFANIEGSEARLLDFVNKFGCLDHSPPFVSYHLTQAARFEKVLSQFETDKKTGSKFWLATFEKLRPAFSRDMQILKQSILNIVPTINAGKLQVFLEPADLLNAIWLQFLLKADDLRLTHCQSCRSFMAVAASLGRSDKRFCSAACKQRDYRRREAERTSSSETTTRSRRVTNRRRIK
jgi:hypothetical protein